MLRRPIIVAFWDFQDTAVIIDSARLLRGTRFRLDREYPAEISKARKLLWNRDVAHVMVLLVNLMPWPVFCS